MRILVWHGWLLEGSGSNVFTARIVEAWRKQGHDVLLVCQEPRPERFRFLDGWAKGDLGAAVDLPADPAPGRAVLFRPEIGDLLPVFVYDRYEGFHVRTFVDLADEELDAYLELSVRALRHAVAWHGPEIVVAGHAIPGAVVARRALDEVPFVAKIHGSDVEYAMRLQPRYVDLAREGLGGAVAVTGTSRDVLDRVAALLPTVGERLHVVPPGVEVARFRPMPRRDALLLAAQLAEAEPARAAGRNADLAREVVLALHRRDAGALDRLAERYDQNAPDVDAPRRLRALATTDEPLVGYLGKLIPQKGVHRLVAALALTDGSPRALLVGFGTFREWLEALVTALDAGDVDGARFLADRMDLELPPDGVRQATGLAARVGFTGRLDHRVAGPALAAFDVLVVPSVLGEAFGMVALEGAAAGALPLVARHSGLAEIAAALEAEIGAPGLLSFDPRGEAVASLAAGLRRLLDIPEPERREMGRRLSALVGQRWTWQETADRLLEAATGGRS